MVGRINSATARELAPLADVVPPVYVTADPTMSVFDKSTGWPGSGLLVKLAAARAGNVGPGVFGLGRPVELVGSTLARGPIGAGGRGNGGFGSSRSTISVA